jgi:hypothetical protein
VKPAVLPRNGAVYLATFLLFAGAAGMKHVLLCCDQLEDLASTTTAKAKRDLETERFRDVILETLPMADMLSTVVTMHPVLLTIGTAWELADLPTFEISEANKHRIVVLSTLRSVAAASKLVGKYLDAARKPDSGRAPGDLYPFTSEAIAALVTRSNRKPRDILRKAHGLVEAAAGDNVDVIDDDAVTRYLDAIGQETRSVWVPWSPPRRRRSTGARGEYPGRALHGPVPNRPRAPRGRAGRRRAGFERRVRAHLDHAGMRNAAGSTSSARAASRGSTTRSTNRPDATRPARRGGRGRIGKVLVGVAVEVRGSGSGRVGLQVLPDASSDTLTAFARSTIAPGTVVHTDGWSGYLRLPNSGYEHHPIKQRWRFEDRREILRRAHRTISNLKTWLAPTTAPPPSTCRYTSTSSPSGTTVAAPRWPPSRRCWAERVARAHDIRPDHRLREPDRHERCYQPPPPPNGTPPGSPPASARSTGQALMLNRWDVLKLGAAATGGCDRPL